MPAVSIPSPVGARRPGRPRSQKARSAILAAAARLIDEQGLRAISMDEVAERAGVSKATIYRWWPSKGSLALEVFLDQVLQSQQPLPDQGSLRRDLLAHVTAVARSYGQTATGRLLADLIGELPADRELGTTFRSKVIEPIRTHNRLIFERAIARGEMRRNVDTDVAMDMIYGAIWERLLVRHGPLNERFARNLVEIALTGLRPRPPEAGARSPVT